MGPIEISRGSQPATRKVAVAIIGAGTAGLAAYRAAAAITPEVLLIESGVGGTTCARVGCMPSKLLIAAADAAQHARNATPFGVTCQVHVDGRAVMERVRNERDRFVGFVQEGVDRFPPETRLQGHARFVAPGLLAVGDERVAADAIVIATGSSPHVPPVFEAIRDRVVVNDDVFSWETLPSSVVVFGAGIIGLELGQALHRLGVRVRVFGRGGVVGPLTDPLVRETAARVLGAEMPLHTDARVHEVRRTGDEVEVVFEDHDGTPRTERFSYALVAAGRRPQVAQLGLEHAGVPLDTYGVPVFDRSTMQCGESSVFLAGDVNQNVPVLHEAADEGMIAGQNAGRYPHVLPGQRRSALAIAFTDPQIALVGARHIDLVGNTEFVVGEVSFEDQGRSRVMLQNQGVCRLYADAATGRFLGAEMVGPRAEHLGHLLAWAHQQQLTVDEMLARPFYHPVVEEGIRTALRRASARLDNRMLAA